MVTSTGSPTGILYLSHTFSLLSPLTCPSNRHFANPFTCQLSEKMILCSQLSGGRGSSGNFYFMIDSRGSPLLASEREGKSYFSPAPHFFKMPPPLPLSLPFILHLCVKSGWAVLTLLSGIILHALKEGG